MRTHFIFTLLLSVFVLVNPVLAADEKSTPVKEWMDAENALIAPLAEKDRESFFILRNKYSVHRVIKIVERDIGNAVKSCGKNNPDMKGKMDARFDQWKNAVDPILDTAKKQLDSDLEKQTLVDVKEARRVLKLNDAAYEDGEKKTTKTPVTTKEACEDLVASMDRTEDNMVELLKQTLLTESVIRKRNDDLKKAEAEQEKKKKSFSETAKEEEKKKQ